MIDLARRLVRQTPLSSFKSGADAKFLRIDERWGLKIFQAKSLRDETYKLQKKAHTIEAAPQIGNKFSLSLEDRRWYGYTTECIEETFWDRYLREQNLDENQFVDSSEEMEIFGQSDSLLEKYGPYKSLIKKLDHYGLDTSDLHSGNVGWMPDGNFVAIDFSCF